MTEQELFRELKYHISAIGITNSEKITSETMLGNTSESLGLDSLDIVELIYELERKTGRICEDIDREKFKTVGDLISFFKE